MGMQETGEPASDKVEGEVRLRRDCPLNATWTGMPWLWHGLSCSLPPLFPSSLSFPLPLLSPTLLHTCLHAYTHNILLGDKPHKLCSLQKNSHYNIYIMLRTQPVLNKCLLNQFMTEISSHFAAIPSGGSQKKKTKIRKQPNPTLHADVSKRKSVGTLAPWPEMMTAHDCSCAWQGVSHLLDAHALLASSGTQQQLPQLFVIHGLWQIMQAESGLGDKDILVLEFLMFQ